MKKLVIYSTAILMVLFSTSLKAQVENGMAMNSVRNLKKSETKAERKEVRREDRHLVSELSMDAFETDFRNASNVIWERDPFFDIASFNRNGHEYKAYYDHDSKLVGTTTDKTFADLPKDAQKQINKEYGDYHVDKVVYFKDNELNDNDMLLYGAQFEDADNYFVEMSDYGKNIVIQVNPQGEIFFFKELPSRI